MGSAAKDARMYTYSEYLKFDDGFRCEIIDGMIYNMSPAPRTIHQEVLVNIIYQIGNYFHDKTCKMFFAPFDVRLPKKGEKSSTTTNVVQPDLLVVCDPKKIDSRGCKGPPDWIIEIISPSTEKKDRRQKFLLYEECGVKEYWIINPDKKIISTFLLEKDGLYGSEVVYTGNQIISPSLFIGLNIDLDKVFT